MAQIIIEVRSDPGQAVKLTERNIDMLVGAVKRLATVSAETSRTAQQSARSRQQAEEQVARSAERAGQQFMRSQQQVANAVQRLQEQTARAVEKAQQQAANAAVRESQRAAHAQERAAQQAARIQAQQFQSAAREIVRAQQQAQQAIERTSAQIRTSIRAHQEERAAAAQAAREAVSGAQAKTASIQGLLAAHRQGSAAVLAFKAAEDAKNIAQRAGIALGSAEHQAIQKATLAYRQAEAEIKKLTTAKFQWAGVTRQLQGMLAGFGVVLGAAGIVNFGRSIIDAYLQADRFARVFRAAAGGVREGAAEMAYAREQAERLGIGLEATWASYSKFSIAARLAGLSAAQTRDIFQAVAETSRIMGLSTQRTELAFLALEQIASKGRVSMEEVRRQLGEQIPGAMQIGARAMGMTTAAFFKAIEAGEVMSKEFLPAFAAELRKTFGSELQSAIDSPAAAFGRLEKASFELKLAIAKDLVPAIADLVEVITKLASNKELLAFLRDLSVALAEVLRLFTDSEEKGKSLSLALGGLAFNWTAVRVAVAQVSATITETFGRAVTGAMEMLGRLIEMTGRAVAALPGAAQKVLGFAGFDAEGAIRFGERLQESAAAALRDALQLADGYRETAAALRAGKTDSEGAALALDLVADAAENAARQLSAAELKRLKLFEQELGKFREMTAAALTMTEALEDVPVQGYFALNDELAKVARNLEIEKRLTSETAELRRMLADKKADATTAALVQRLIAAAREEITLLVDAERALELAGVRRSLREAAADAMALGEAALQGEDAYRRMLLEVERSVAIRDKAASAIGKEREQIILLIDEEIRAQQVRANREAEAAYRRESTALTALNAARLLGVDAVIRISREQEIQNRILEEMRGKEDSLRASVERRVRAQADAAQFGIISDLAAQYRQAAIEVARLAEVQKAGPEALAREQAILQANNALRQAGLALTVKGVLALRDQIVAQLEQGRLLAEAGQLIQSVETAEEARIRAVAKANQLYAAGLITLEQHARAVLATNAAWQQVLSGLESSFASFFESVLRGEGESAFKALGEALLDVFIKTLADMLARWIATEIAMTAVTAKQAAVRAGFNAASAAAGGGGSVGGAIGPFGGIFNMGRIATAGGGGGGAGAGAWLGANWAFVAGFAAVAAFAVWKRHEKSQHEKRQFDTGVFLGGGTGDWKTWAGGKLNQTAAGMQEALLSVVRALEEGGGIFIRDMGQIFIKVRNDKKQFQAFLDDQLVGIFRTAEEAMMAAMRKALLGADFAAQLDPAVRQVIQNGKFAKPEQLAEALRYVQSVVDTASGLTSLELEMRQFMRTIGEMETSLKRAGVSAADAARLSAEAGMRQLDAWRDQITGRTRTAQEELAERQRQAQLFNAQLALYKAQVEAEVALLEARVRTQIGFTELRQSELMVEGEFLRARQQLLSAEGQLTTQYVSVIGAGLGTANEIMNTQLDALRQILANLPAPIDPSEIRIGGGGGGAGGRRAFVDELAEIARSAVPDAARALIELRERMEEVAASAVRFGIDASEAMAILQQQFDLAVQESILTLAESMAQRIGDEKTLAALAEIRYDLERAQFKLQIEALRVLNVLTAEQLQQLEDLYNALPPDLPVAEAFASIEEAIDALGLQSQQTRQEFARLQEAMQYLLDHAEELGAEFSTLMAELADSLFVAFGDKLMGFLDRYYEGVEGYEEFRMTLERVRFELELANLRLQFELLKGMGLLSQDVINQIQGLFDWIAGHPIQWPGAPPPSTIGGGPFVPGYTPPVPGQPGIGGGGPLGLPPGGGRPGLIPPPVFVPPPPWLVPPPEPPDVTDPFEEAGNAAEELADRLNRAKEALQDFYESLTLSELSPLTDAQRFAEAQQQAFQAVAAAGQGDIEAIESLPERLRAYLEAAAAQFGTAGVNYAEIFAWVQQVAALFAAQAGGIVTPPPPPSTGNVVPFTPAGAASALPPPSGVAPSAAAQSRDQEIAELRRANALLAEQNAILRDLRKVEQGRLSEERLRRKAS